MQCPYHPKTCPALLRRFQRPRTSKIPMISGFFKTAPTAAYPSRLCRALARLAWDFVLPAAASVGGTMRTTAGDSYEDPLEAMAASILVPSHQQLLQIIEGLPGEKPSRGEILPGTKSFTTGAYSVGGGLAGVRSNTRAFPEVSALLCRYISSLRHDFCFMAAAVFVNLRTTPHRDLGNLSGSFNLVSGVGAFSGGEVWVSSGSGSVPCPFPGFSEMGELLPTAGTFAVFDPRNLHCTASWSGDRIVVVGFTPYFGASMDAADVEFLDWASGRLPGWHRPTEPRWIGSWTPTTTVLAKSIGPTGKTWMQMGLRPRAVPPKRMRMAYRSRSMVPASWGGAPLEGGSFGQAQVLLRRAWSCVTWALVLRAKALRVVRWGTPAASRHYAGSASAAFFQA